MKLALIGLGPIGSMHIDNITANLIPDCELVAVCDVRKVDNQKINSLPFYENVDDLLKDESIDSVLISTPSFTHIDLAIKCLKAKKNVLVEKPLALCTKDILKIKDVANKEGKLACVMLNQRTNPLYMRIKELVSSGSLGAINRVSWNMTNWYRPEVYYKCNTWRGTFKGEAGGALINQSIHNIDTFAWIFGLPKNLRAWCKFGKYHDIEVEDEVTCFMQYENDMTATFITSTGEHPGSNRFEISGEKGYIIAEDGILKKYMYKNGSLSEFTKSTKFVFGTPETEDSIEKFEGKGEQHIGVLKNFASAVNNSTKLDYDSDQGYLSVCLSNSMLMSTWLNSDIKFPFDDDTYAKLLSEKMEKSEFRKEIIEDFTMDFGKSFR